jgi:hypothetical protein
MTEADYKLLEQAINNLDRNLSGRLDTVEATLKELTAREENRVSRLNVVERETAMNERLHQEIKESLAQGNSKFSMIERRLSEVEKNAVYKGDAEKNAKSLETWIKLGQSIAWVIGAIIAAYLFIIKGGIK